MSQPAIVYTDGACSGNPGPGGWGAIVALPGGPVTELGGGERHTTNNRMEIIGALEALRALAGQPDLPVRLHTDSSYLIKGITEWVQGWRRRGWRKPDGQPVLNRDLWEALLEVLGARSPSGRVSWVHVRGHAGIPGNERCDRISVAFSQGRPMGLYRGSAEGYEIDLTPPGAGGSSGRSKPSGKRGSFGGVGDAGNSLDSGPGHTSARSRVSSARHADTDSDSDSDGAGSPLRARRHVSVRPARPTGDFDGPYYVSLVEGVLERHETWDQCRLRVHGRSRALYRKVSDPTAEDRILAEWGHGDGASGGDPY